jgi:hypothetical protein
VQAETEHWSHTDCATESREKRAAVGEGGYIPRYPAAYLKIDSGIVPGSQQSPEISNWFQDEIIAMINKSLPEAKVNAKMLGVFYHRKLFRGQYVYMVHAKNAMVQEIVASALHKTTRFRCWCRGGYNAAKEMDGMESGLNA